MVDKESGTIFFNGLKGLAHLDETERLIFVQRVTAIFLIWFNAHLQYQRKLIPTEFWVTFASDIASNNRFGPQSGIGSCCRRRGG